MLERVKKNKIYPDMRIDSGGSYEMMLAINEAVILILEEMSVSTSNESVNTDALFDMVIAGVDMAVAFHDTLDTEIRRDELIAILSLLKNRRKG